MDKNNLDKVREALSVISNMKIENEKARNHVKQAYKHLQQAAINLGNSND